MTRFLTILLLFATVITNAAFTFQLNKHECSACIDTPDSKDSGNCECAKEKMLAPNDYPGALLLPPNDNLSHHPVLLHANPALDNLTPPPDVALTS